MLPQEGENRAFAAAAAACSVSLIPSRIGCPCCASTHKAPKFIAERSYYLPRLLDRVFSSRYRGDNTTKYLSCCWEGCGLVPLWCALAFFFSLAQKLEGKCNGKTRKFSPPSFPFKNYTYRRVRMSVCSHTEGGSTLLMAARGQIVFHACEAQQYRICCTTETFPLWWLSWAVWSAKTSGEHSN